jgi:hypothetical protein
MSAEKPICNLCEDKPCEEVAATLEVTTSTDTMNGYAKKILDACRYFQSDTRYSVSMDSKISYDFRGEPRQHVEGLLQKLVPEGYIVEGTKV